MAPSGWSAAPFGEDVRSDLSLRAKRGRGAGEIGRGADVEDSDSGGSCGEDLGQESGHSPILQFCADWLKSQVRLPTRPTRHPLSCAKF